MSQKDEESTALNTEKKFSVLLPTYCEKDNLPLIIKLIFDMAEKNNLDF